MSTPRQKYGHGANPIEGSVTAQMYDGGKSSVETSMGGNNSVKELPNMANDFDLHFSNTAPSDVVTKKTNPHVHVRSVLANGSQSSGPLIRSGVKPGALTQSSSLSDLVMYIGTPISFCPHVSKVVAGKTVYFSVDPPMKVLSNTMMKQDVQISQVGPGKDAAAAEVWLSSKVQYAFPGETYDSGTTSSCKIAVGGRALSCRIQRGKKQYITVFSAKGCTLTQNYSFYRQPVLKSGESSAFSAEEQKPFQLTNTPSATVPIAADGTRPWEMGSELNTSTGANARTIVSKKLQLLRSDQFMYNSFMAKVKETQAQLKASNKPNDPQVRPDSPQSPETMIEYVDIPPPNLPDLKSPTPLTLDQGRDERCMGTASEPYTARDPISHDVRKVKAQRHNMHVEMVATQNRDLEKMKQEAFAVSQGIRTELQHEQKELAEEHIQRQLQQHQRRSWSVQVYYIMFMKHLHDTGVRLGEIQSERRLTISAVVNIQRVFRRFLARRSQKRTLERILRLKTLVGFLSAASQATKRDRAADVVYMILRQQSEQQKTDNLTKAVRGYRRKVVIIQRAWRRTYLCRAAKQELWSLAWARHEASRGTPSGLQQSTIDMLLQQRHLEDIAKAKQEMMDYYDKLADWKLEMAKQTTTRAMLSTVGGRASIMPPMRPHAPIRLSAEWQAEAVNRGQVYERELLIQHLRSTSVAPFNSSLRRSSTISHSAVISRKSSIVSMPTASIPSQQPTQSNRSMPVKNELAKRNKK